MTDIKLIENTIIAWIILVNWCKWWEHRVLTSRISRN